MRGSKITADGDCSDEIKRRLLLGRKVMTNLDSIFKSRVPLKDETAVSSANLDIVSRLCVYIKVA